MLNTTSLLDVKKMLERDFGYKLYSYQKVTVNGYGCEVIVRDEENNLEIKSIFSKINPVPYLPFDYQDVRRMALELQKKTKYMKSPLYQKLQGAK